MTSVHSGHRRCGLHTAPVERPRDLNSARTHKSPDAVSPLSGQSNGRAQRVLYVGRRGPIMSRVDFPQPPPRSRLGKRRITPDTFSTSSRADCAALEPWTYDLIRQAKCKDGRVLDLACGTGFVALAEGIFASWQLRAVSFAPRCSRAK
jgi:hypothetical protein